MSDLFTLFNEDDYSRDNRVASQKFNLESISKIEEEQNFAFLKSDELKRVELKIDYSDFSNFVFFNSAYDYFNITGEKILNDYPYDGSKDLLQMFFDDVDGYQKHVINNVWPRSKKGHLHFNALSQSYVTIDDIGLKEGVTTVGLLDPGTGSYTIEGWFTVPPSGTITGSNDSMFLFDKRLSTGVKSGYSLRLGISGSESIFSVYDISGNSSHISASLVEGTPTYVACVIDRENKFIKILTGSIGEFPVIASSASISSIGNLYTSGSQLTLCSGSDSSYVTKYFTGSLDEVRIWNVARSITDISSSYNSNVYAQKNLVGMWKFNESGSVASSGQNIVLDYSGNKLDGMIQNYYSHVRMSGTLLPYDRADELILDINAPEVQAIVLEQQTSGSDYDRDNDNIITLFLPQSFFEMEEYRNTMILRDFIYIMARMFDYIKIHIDQFVKVFNVNYGKYNQTPDALLEEAAQFYGWKFVGSFLDKSFDQYIVGKNILDGPEKNREIDKKLYQIKNEFWKRILLNLAHIYKTKGTRESVYALLRAHGVDKNFIRLKEYSFRNDYGFVESRFDSEKSVPAVAIGSGTVSGSAYVSSEDFNSVFSTCEFRVMFPTTSSVDMPATLLTGSIFTLTSASRGEEYLRVRYYRDSLSHTTGNLELSGLGFSNISLTGANVFDGRWHNIHVRNEYPTGKLQIGVRTYQDGEIIQNISSSVNNSPSTPTYREYTLFFGATGSINSQYRLQEVRVWDDALLDKDLDDHCLNFQSVGRTSSLDLDNLVFHWRLNENVSASSDGAMLNFAYDIGGRDRIVTGSAFNFVPLNNPFKRFLNGYSYLTTPGEDWDGDKIRTHNESTYLDIKERSVDSNRLSLEFNMVDALNEDISQMFSTYDELNEAIGSPVNRYRDSYDDLKSVKDFYFKRLQGRLNFKKFFDMLDLFDRSFLTMVKKLIPARANFSSEEMIVESHALERNKIVKPFVRHEQSYDIEGVITVLERNI